MLFRLQLNIPVGKLICETFSALVCKRGIKMLPIKALNFLEDFNMVNM
jgi:hypothetical protein